MNKFIWLFVISACITCVSANANEKVYCLANENERVVCTFSKEFTMNSCDFISQDEDANWATLFNTDDIRCKILNQIDLWDVSKMDSLPREHVVFYRKIAPSEAIFVLVILFIIIFLVICIYTIVSFCFKTAWPAILIFLFSVTSIVSSKKTN